MKVFRGFCLFLSLLFLFSCEVFQEEDEVVCLPTNMTATIVQGANTTKIIADFHYVEGEDLLDHITWSNHQTHYFEHDDSDRLMVVRQMKVKEKIQEELWFEYDGTLVDRVVLVKKHLDYTYLEPIDSLYAGHIDYTYEGMHITLEERYEVPKEGGGEVLVKRADYQYDVNGNIISATIHLPGESKTAEIVTLTYDTCKHPFSGLLYYFNGESYVNSILSMATSDGNLEYTYDNRLNAQDYPEIIYEKLGTTNTRIIRYSYRCG